MFRNDRHEGPDQSPANAGVNDHAVILVAEARLPKLERLWLRSNQLDEASLSRLGSRLPRLQVLDLAHNDPGQLGVEALGHASLPALRELDLSNCALTDDMVIALAASPLIEQLAWLDLGHNEIGPAAARALASVQLPALRFLDLSSTAMGDEVALVKHAHPHARLVARAR